MDPRFAGMAGHGKHNAGPKAGVAFHTPRPRESVYFVMSTSLVSRRNSEPITKVISAMMIGYHRPW